MYKTQEKEIATIREKNIKLKLSEADCERLANLCGKHGLTVADLLEQFVGDLVDGTYSNGSDERSCARAWFDRCGFGMFPETTLLVWLFDEFIEVEDFLELLENMETGEAEMLNYEKHPGEYDKEEIEFLKSDLESWEEEVQDYKVRFLKKKPDDDWKQEVEKVKKWFEERERLKNE